MKDFLEILTSVTTIIPLFGAFAAILGKLVTDRYFFGGEKEETLEDRVDRLTNSLKEATNLISNIESEIAARSNLAAQLQEDVERFNKLSKLKQPEVEAIAQVLRGELVKEGSKSFWKGAALNFGFFILGAGASWLINIITLPKPTVP